jgi:hypothetical protein
MVVANAETTRNPNALGSITRGICDCFFFRRDCETRSNPVYDACRLTHSSSSRYASICLLPARVTTAFCSKYVHGISSWLYWMQSLKFDFFIRLQAGPQSGAHDSAHKIEQTISLKGCNNHFRRYDLIFT